MLAGLRSCALPLLVASAACGGGDPAGDPPGGPATPAAAACTGEVPPHSTACPDASSGLSQDAPRVATSACTYPAAPCSYVCDAGYVLEGGACVTAPPPPPPQFVDHGDGTVTVTTTTGSLTWLRDAGCQDAVTVQGQTFAGGTGTWQQATSWAAGLAAGVCGLSDGSAQGDWRLPTHVELARLGLQLDGPNPFQGVEPGVYWSSWTYWPHMAGGVELPGGTYLDYPREYRLHMWAVRG